MRRALVAPATATALTAGPATGADTATQAGMSLGASLHGRDKAVRLTTLAALCEALECRPGDILRWESEETAGEDGAPGQPRRHVARSRT